MNKYHGAGASPDLLEVTPSQTAGEIVSAGNVMTPEELQQFCSDRLPHFVCLDCRRNTNEIGHYYMVHFKLWRQYGVPTGMLCIDCLEQRLDRPLRVEDFLPCPATEMYLAELGGRHLP